MSLTRGNILDRICGSSSGSPGILGDNSTDFRTYMATSLNNALFTLYDMHDWEFKHKSGTFNTVAGTESYNLSTSSADIRSSQDVEILYDTTNGRWLDKVDLQTIRKNTPKEDSSGQPVRYAPWGAKTIFLEDEPSGIFVMKYLYLAKPTLPTQDSHDLETQCGLPDYMHPILEKMVLAEAYEYHDDSRLNALLLRLGSPSVKNSLIYNAVMADMKHLNSGARFKFWEEVLIGTGTSFDDFLRRAWSGSGV